MVDPIKLILFVGLYSL